MAFTRTELAKYNGKNGNPAYVAYRGKVYDISSAAPDAFGLFAGRDVSDNLELEEIRSVLEKGIIVGGLSDG